MSQSDPDRIRRILFVAGWVVGGWGLLLLADDIFEGTTQNNLSGVVLIVIAIAVLAFSRRGANGPKDEPPGSS